MATLQRHLRVGLDKLVEVNVGDLNKRSSVAVPVFVRSARIDDLGLVLVQRIQKVRQCLCRFCTFPDCLEDLRIEIHYCASSF